jgi:hypothetical protein
LSYRWAQVKHIYVCIGIFLKIEDCERGVVTHSCNTGTATPSLLTGSEASVRRKGEKTVAAHMRFLRPLLEVCLQPG